MGCRDCGGATYRLWEYIVGSSWRLRRLHFPTTPATAPARRRPGDRSCDQQCCHPSVAECDPPADENDPPGPAPYHSLPCRVLEPLYFQANACECEPPEVAKYSFLRCRRTGTSITRHSRIPRRAHSMRGAVVVGQRHSSNSCLTPSGVGGAFPLHRQSRRSGSRVW
jgi:hypothetical protein